MVEHRETWYIRRLEEYFEDHYWKYSDTVEWFPNPGPDTWKFRIPELDAEITISCDETGKIRETFLTNFRIRK